MAANAGNNAVSPPRDNLLEYSWSERLILLSHCSFSGNAFHLDFFWQRFSNKCLNLRLRSQWLQVRIPLLSLKLQIWRLLWARSSWHSVWIHSETLTWHDNNIQLISNFSLLFSSKLFHRCLQAYRSQLLDLLFIKLYPFLSMPWS